MGSNFKRRLKRQKIKTAKKELATKVSLFGQLEDECLVCTKPFNKKDKEQVTSWSVVVKKEEKKVNLYCPDCWNKAVGIIDDFKKHLEKKNDH